LVVAADRVDRLRVRLEQRNPGRAAGRVESDQAGQQQCGARAAPRLPGRIASAVAAAGQQPGGDDERDADLRRLTQMLGHETCVCPRADGTGGYDDPGGNGALGPGCRVVILCGRAHACLARCAGRVLRRAG
jgi:hypothetical protein